MFTKVTSHVFLFVFLPIALPLTNKSHYLAITTNGVGSA